MREKPSMDNGLPDESGMGFSQEAESVPEPVLDPAIDGQTIGQVHGRLRPQDAAGGNNVVQRYVMTQYPYAAVESRVPYQSLTVVVPASAYGMPDIGLFKVGGIMTTSPGSLAAVRLLMFVWRTCYEVQRGLGKTEPPRRRKQRDAEEGEEEDEPDPDPRIGDLFDHQPGDTSFTCKFVLGNGNVVGGPAIVLVREALFNHNGAIAGMRFTFENYVLETDLNRAVRQRILRWGLEQAENGPRRTYAASSNDASVSAQITSTETWGRTLVEYFGPNSTPGRMLDQNMHLITSPSAGTGIDVATNPACPTSILSFVNTASLVQRVVIPEQLDFSKYGMESEYDTFCYREPLVRYATFGMPVSDPVEVFYNMVYDIPRQMKIWLEVLIGERGPNEPFRIGVPAHVMLEVEDTIKVAMTSEFAQPEPMVLAPGSTLMTDSEAAAQKSFVARRRQTYAPIRLAIKRLQPRREEDRADPDVVARTALFNSAMDKFVKEKIEEVWEQDLCHPSGLVKTASSAQIAAMQHVACMTKNDWPDFAMVASNLGLTSNLILSWFNRMVQAFRVKAGTAGRNIMILWLGSMAVATFVPGRCMPNTTFFDDAETGKSFVLSAVQKMCLPGSILVGSVLTPKALSADTNLSAMTILFHEAEARHFGLGGDGRPSTKDDGGFHALLKTALTEGEISTVALSLGENGERVAVVSRNRIGAAFHFASNTMPKAEGTVPMLSRTIRIVGGGVHSVTEPSEQFILSVPTSTEQEEVVQEDFLRETRTIHALVVLTGMYVEMGVLPMPNTDIGIRLIRNLNEFIIKRSYEPLNTRKIEQIEGLFIGLTIQLAVMKVVASELADFYRPDRNGQARSIGPWFFEALRKFLFLDLETAVFVLTLMTEMIMPDLTSNVLRRISELIENKEISPEPMTIRQGLRVTTDDRYHVFEVPKIKLAAMVARGLPGVTATAVMEAINTLMNRTVTGEGSYLTETRDSTGANVMIPHSHPGQWIARVMTHVGPLMEGNGGATGRTRGDRFAVCKNSLQHDVTKSSRHVFHDFLTKTLGHAFARGQTLLTAFPMYVSGREIDTCTTINALSTFTVVPDPANVSIFRSGAQTTACDHLLGQSRQRAPAVVKDRSLNVVITAADYDEEAAENFHRSIGVPVSESEALFPWRQTIWAKTIRAENHARFEGAGMRMIDYPREYLVTRQKELALRSLVNPEIVTKDVALAMACDPQFNQSVLSRTAERPRAKRGRPEVAAAAEEDAFPATVDEVIDEKIKKMRKLLGPAAGSPAAEPAKDTTPSVVAPPVDAAPARGHDLQTMAGLQSFMQAGGKKKPMTAKSVLRTRVIK